MSRDSSLEREEEGHELKIYIDKRILNQNGQPFNNVNQTQHKIASKFDTVYEIHGEIFREERQNDNDLFLEFEVQLNNRNDNAKALEKMETDDIYLEISIRENNEGIIINSCIFLTLNQWNTLIVDENYKFCFVCDDVVESHVHIKMVAHMENLQRCRPLKKFDLSITRLIGESYHCAVCNVMFDKNNDNNHFDSKSHKDKMDHARNRALEVTLSDENESSEYTSSNNEAYFDRNRINSFNSIVDYKSCEEFDDYDLSNDVGVNNGNNHNSTSYASMAKKPSTTPKYINDIYLEISIRENNEGIIINSCIFLTLNQWNTLIVDENYKFCFVCDDVVESHVHIKMVAHMENLQRCRPLKKFDLSITRLIGESYHCAVCNVMFDKNNDNNHFDSKSHKDKMDHARNRALELTLSDENESSEYTSSNNEAYFDRNRINSFNSIVDYKSCEEFDDYDLSNDVGFNNGNNLNSTSYASMAKKPSTTPKYITQTVAGKKYNISFDHWHMVIYPRSKEFYCMTCKIFDRVSLKATHCSEENHMENLNKCHFVEKYNRYLIRQMSSDFKFYHCGLCNELILITHVEDHIATVHDKKYENINDSAVDKNKIQHKIGERKINNDCSLNRNNDESRNRNNDESRNRNNDESIKFQKIDMMNHNKMNIFRETYEIDNISPGLYNDVILNQFSCKLRVSFVAYNVVLKLGQGFFCGICNLSTNENIMKHHIASLNHVGKLRNIPFESYFGSNLIRLINNIPHCTICNILLDEASLTLPHVASEIHLALLNQASKIPDVLTPVKFKDSINQKKQIDSNQLIMNQPKTDSQDNKIKSNEHLEFLDDTIELIENYEHEFLYLNFRNKNSKVTFNSYHSLVAIGDGTRYCFVCSHQIVGCTKQHIESKAHTISMKKCKFLDKFDKHLLRQMFLLYHCCTCNVIFSKKYLNAHLTWPIQEVKTSKKIRKADFNSGIKLLHVQSQKEEIYLKMQESNMEFIGRIDIKPKSNNIEIKKENKIIILDSIVLKLSWDAWQGIIKKKNGMFCCLCDKDLKNFELNSHIYEEWHANVLENTFEKQYFPNLIRKVNDTTLNCLICNLVIPSKKHIILEHINGKNHKINYDTIHDNSATVNTYTDCNDNVLYL